MTINQLTYQLCKIFLAVFKLRNASQAATELGISNSAISRALASLREMYDDPLFVRTQSGFCPTQKAVEISQTMVEIVQLFRKMDKQHSKFDPFTSEGAFELRVYDEFCFPTLKVINEKLLPRAPKMRFNTRILSHNCIPELINGEVDFAIVYEGFGDPRLNYECFAETSDIYLFGRTGHPLFTQKKFSIDHDFLKNCCIGADQAIAKVNSVDWKDIERVTGLTQKQIEEFADVYGHAERIIIRAGYGMQRNYNGARMTRAIAIMQAMRGMFDKPSCGIIYDNVRPITGMNLNLGRGNYLRKGKQQHVNMTDLDMALKAENPTTENRPIKPIHLLVIYNGNPVAVSPNVNAVIENLKRKDLFVVGFDMIMTDSLEYCDLILPASTQFETDDIIGDYHSWYVQICEKVIEPVGESKPNWDFFAEWGRRMGFKDQAFRDTPKDIIRQFLQTETPWYQGITLERLEKEKFIHLDMPESVPVRSGGKAETESSKIELYSNIMKKAGFDPVIDLALCEEEMPEEEKNLPFRLLSPGIPQRVNSSFYNVKYIRAYNAYECEVNPEDAKRLGIKSGDKVRLNNQRGEAFFVARVTTRVAPGVVRTAKCNWRSTNPYGQNTNTNSLTTGKLTDMGGCSAYHSTRVNLSKA